jgi:hypothetical protein
VERLNITLDGEQAEKLARLAGRMHLQPGTVARSLLSSALDDADPDARNVAELLDRLPGAFERAQLGLEQARAGETVALDLILKAEDRVVLIIQDARSGTAATAQRG